MIRTADCEEYMGESGKKGLANWNTQTHTKESDVSANGDPIINLYTPLELQEWENFNSFPTMQRLRAKHQGFWMLSASKRVVVTDQID